MGMHQNQIARFLGLHKPTISRELRQDQGLCDWRPKQVHAFFEQRQNAGNKGKRFSSGKYGQDSPILFSFSPRSRAV